MAANPIPIIDADEYAESFMQWRKQRCALSSRFSTNVSSIYRDYAAWCDSNDDWQCDQQQFIELMQQTGTKLFSVGALVLASGIGLVDDVALYALTTSG